MNSYPTPTTENPANVETVNHNPPFRPDVDILEEGDSLVLLADIPGADESRTDVTLEKNVLSIKGTVTPVEFEGYTSLYSEYKAGAFERSFTIPREIDRDNIEATVSDGILRVVLPRSKDAGVQKISVATK